MNFIIFKTWAGEIAVNADRICSIVPVQDGYTRLDLAGGSDIHLLASVNEILDRIADAKAEAE
ncbi:hypothetical protein QBK99_08140 [Corticibacterium sp. UT-5YL-CI-8]|nr:hypothetical protein [Tianweitania sp. UT-5YL-CI-8]